MNGTPDPVADILAANCAALMLDSADDVRAEAREGREACRRGTVGRASSTLPGSSARGLDAPIEAKHAERIAKLRRAVRLVGFVDDKPRFFEAYAAGLACRLLGGSSCSLSLEKLALQWLRPMAPYELASRLRRMLIDYGLSATLTEEHEAWAEGARPLDEARPLLLTDEPHVLALEAETPPEVACTHAPVALRVLVLTAGAWPSTVPAPSDLPLPRSILSAQASFAAFYSRRHGSRCLAWLPATSVAEVHTRYLPTDRLLHVAAPQLAVLLSFGGGPTERSLRALAGASRLPADAFRRALLSLLNAGLLLADEPAGSQGLANPPTRRSDEGSAEESDTAGTAGAAVPAAAAAAAATGLVGPATRIRLNLRWSGCFGSGNGSSNGDGCGSGGRGGGGGGGECGVIALQGLLENHVLEASRCAAEAVASRRRGAVAIRTADDARVLVQAAVVRLLKRHPRRQMAHAELHTSVARTLAAQRIDLEPGLFRTCVEYLLDKEFIARDDADREIYVYVP